MRTHILKAKVFFPPCNVSYSVIFLLIVVLQILFVYVWISFKKPGCGSEASGLWRQTHVQGTPSLSFSPLICNFQTLLSPWLDILIALSFETSIYKTISLIYTTVFCCLFITYEFQLRLIYQLSG